jgi:hypothetical protein
MRPLLRMAYHAPPSEPRRLNPGSTRAAGKYLIGEVAERSKALDWNSSNISTGVRGFESHPLRQNLKRGRLRPLFKFWLSGCVDEPTGFDKIARSDFGRRAASGPKGLRPGRPQHSHPLRQN